MHPWLGSRYMPRSPRRLTIVILAKMPTNGGPHQSGFTLPVGNKTFVVFRSRSSTPSAFCLAAFRGVRVQTRYLPKLPSRHAAVQSPRPAQPAPPASR
jgi:hypothetical protein